MEVSHNDVLMVSMQGGISTNKDRIDQQWGKITLTFCVNHSCDNNIRGWSLAPVSLEACEILYGFQEKLEWATE